MCVNGFFFVWLQVLPPDGYRRGLSVHPKHADPAVPAMVWADTGLRPAASVHDEEPTGVVSGRYVLALSATWVINIIGCRIQLQSS